MNFFLLLSFLLAAVLSVRPAPATPTVTPATINITMSTPPGTTADTTSCYTSTTMSTATPTTPYAPITQRPVTQSLLLCHPGWEAFEGRCYYFVNDYLLWPQALSICAMLDATLVTIHSPQEYGFLQQLATTNQQSSAWTGGFYLEHEWLWLDGSWFFNNTNMWSEQSQFSSNPCLLLNANEGWYNTQCNAEGYTAICVKDSNVPQGMMCPDGWVMFKGRCYYVQSEGMTWPQADTNCATLEATLVSVHSPQEFAFLQQITLSSSWLGGIFFQDQWMWLDGSWFYQNLFSEVSHPGSQYACLATYNYAGWSNYPCNTFLPSICVRDGI